MYEKRLSSEEHQAIKYLYCIAEKLHKLQGISVSLLIQSNSN